MDPIIAGGPLGPTLNGIGQDLGGTLSTLLSGGVPALLSNPLAPVLQAFADVALPRLGSVRTSAGY